MERPGFRFESLLLREAHRSFVSSPSPRYYVPGDRPWPFLGALALFLTVSGAATLALGSHQVGVILLSLGVASLLAVVAGWFISTIGAADVAGFGMTVSPSFRWCTLAFLGVQVLLFAACWSSFAVTSELLTAAVSPGSLTRRGLAQGQLPLLLSSVTLLASSIAVLVAQSSLPRGRTRWLPFSLAVGIVLGIVFLAVQAPQYGYALGLFGAGPVPEHRSLLLFCLGIHGVHVVLGLVLLASLWVHALKAHFTATQVFGLTAVAWYWHFLDAAWVMLALLAYFR